MKRIVICAVIGIVVQLLAVVLTGFAGAACHCPAPIGIFFPFAVLAGDESTLGSLSLLLQFPGEAVILAMVSLRLDGVWTALTFLMLLGIHFVAALMASQVHP